jgi:asparagine synthase (glutamine-hydrolysing)
MKALTWLRSAVARRRGRAIRARLAPAVADIIDRVKADRLTYLTEARLAHVAACCVRLEGDQVPGTFIEAGCALGGSSIVIASTKSRQRPLRVYDTFGMIPPPTERDGADVKQRYAVIARGAATGIGGDTYYGYQEDLRSKVKANLERYGVAAPDNAIVLVQGLLEDTLTIEGPVAFAHIDVDWYSPVKACLERIVPRLSKGGIIIVDDYMDWSGCRSAVDEHFRDTRRSFAFDTSLGALRITRRG